MGKGVFTKGTAKEGVYRNSPMTIHVVVGRLSKVFTPSSKKAAEDRFASSVRQFRHFSCRVTVCMVQDGITIRRFDNGDPSNCLLVP